MDTKSTEYHQRIIESFLNTIMDELQSIQMMLDIQTSPPGEDGQDRIEKVRISAANYRDELRTARSKYSQLEEDFEEDNSPSPK